MEKGKLSINSENKGHIESQIIPLENETKTYKLPYSNFIIPGEIESYHDKIIEYEIKLGDIINIRLEGKIIYEKNKPSNGNQKNSRDKHNKGGSGNNKSNIMNANWYSDGGSSDGKATAPYNFISLNNLFVKPASGFIDAAKYHSDKNTGYIDISITNKTPLYIRSTSQKSVTKSINPAFFSPANFYSIPGSSLRGAIRNIFEIVTFGQFGFTEDKMFYYRTFASGSTSLRESYNNRMVSMDDVKKTSMYKMNAGLLYKKGRDYLIRKCKFRKIWNGRDKSVPDSEKNESSLSLVQQVNRNTKTLEAQNFYRINDNTFIVVSGYMNGKKYDWKVEGDTSGKDQNIQKDILIPEEDIKNYIKDKTRGKVIDIFKKLKSKDNKFVPIFYVEWKDKEGKSRISFGHTPLFRLSYEKTVYEHIPEQIRPFSQNNSKNSEQKEPDMTELVFGNETDHAGRVFFEDAVLLEKDESKVDKEIKVPMILSGPKPTSVQLYLEQSTNDKNNLKNYNDGIINIRGNKLYWHRDPMFEEEAISYKINKHGDLKEQLKEMIKKAGGDPAQYIIEEPNKKGKIDIFKVKLRGLPDEAKKIIIDNIMTIPDKSDTDKAETQHTVMSPISSNAEFKGRIRFENLSDIELGALLFSINLKDDLCHKIGMGKPLGLGSVKIFGKLHLSDRRKRYADLFYEWNGIEEAEPSKTSEKVKVFEDYILSNMPADAKNLKSIWAIERLKELEKMLNFNIRPGLEKTQYMELNDFRKLSILPSPKKV